MYLFYADGSGGLTEKYSERDFLYVYTAISIYERRWHGFEKTLRRKKEILCKNHNAQLQLSDCEIKSNWIRLPKERLSHPFLSILTPEELTELVDLYYLQLEKHYMKIFSVVIDKRSLPTYFDSQKLHRKAWELLIEMIENYLREEHDSHQGLIVVDDEGKKANLALSLKHAYQQDVGTSSGLWLKHIVEMPLFTPSELSNGIQLADLVGYNINKVFSCRNTEYAFFKRIEKYIHRDKKKSLSNGLRLFPDDSILWDVWVKIAQAGALEPRLL
jgi:hypothetical protein